MRLSQVRLKYIISASTRRKVYSRFDEVFIRVRDKTNLRPLLDHS